MRAVDAEDHTATPHPVAPKRARSRLHGSASKRALGHRHHVRLDRRRLVLPRGRFSTSSRGASSAGRSTRRSRRRLPLAGARHGHSAPSARRPGCCTTPTAAVSTPATTTARARRARRHRQHEPQGQLLGQRRRRELLRHDQNRALHRQSWPGRRSSSAGASSSTSRSSTTDDGFTRRWTTNPRQGRTGIRPSRLTASTEPREAHPWPLGPWRRFRRTNGPRANVPRASGPASETLGLLAKHMGTNGPRTVRERPASNVPRSETLGPLASWPLGEKSENERPASERSASERSGKRNAWPLGERSGNERRYCGAFAVNEHHGVRFATGITTSSVAPAAAQSSSCVHGTQSVPWPLEVAKLANGS